MTKKQEAVYTVAIVVLSTLAVPFLAGCAGEGRIWTNETNATTALLTIASAQECYARDCGNGGYAATLVVLGAPATAARGGFIEDPSLKSLTPQKSGYNFAMTAGAGSGPGPIDCNGTPTVTRFYATATPVTLGTTGTRSFGVNEPWTKTSGAIWMVLGPTAPTEPFGFPAEEMVVR
jgi:hypothetical protein